MSSEERGVTTGSTRLSELVDYLDRFLGAADYEDYGPNGLQVEGRRTVTRLVTGVSACGALFERAIETGADAVVVHHGLFWNNLSRRLTGVQYRRVSQLVHAGTSLIAYHLPLDAHPKIGNNALAAEALQLQNLGPFGEARGRMIGVRGSLPEALSAQDLGVLCETVFGQAPQILGNDDSHDLRSVAIVSGGAQEQLYQAISAGVDVFLTGEASEWVTNLAREAGICYVAAGHHATERLGVRALGAHLADRFGIRADFIDVPNPV